MGVKRRGGQKLPWSRRPWGGFFGTTWLNGSQNEGSTEAGALMQGGEGRCGLADVHQELYSWERNGGETSARDKCHVQFSVLSWARGRAFVSVSWLSDLPHQYLGHPKYRDIRQGC